MVDAAVSGWRRRRVDGRANVMIFICLLEHRFDVGQGEQAADAGPELGHVFLAVQIGLHLASLALEELGTIVGTWSLRTFRNTHASGGSRVIS